LEYSSGYGKGRGFFVNVFGRVCKLHGFTLVYTIHLLMKNMELYGELFDYNGIKISAWMTL
jgi:hypothetical protein